MVPVPLHYGLGFDWQLFVPLAIIFVVTALEAIGDMTATSDISGEPLEGPVYMARIKGACWQTAPTPCWRRSSTFPMSTFAQNNGVIQLTGGQPPRRPLHRRHAGPARPVPGGGESGTTDPGTRARRRHHRHVRHHRRRRGAHHLPGGAGPPRPDDPGGVARHGSGVAQVPEVLQHLPELARSVLSYGVATGGLTAILLNLLLPRRAVAQA